MTTTVTPADVAVEMGRATPDLGSVTYDQWERWIDRADRAITRRAESLGIDPASLDQATVDDVVTFAVVRRITRPADGADSATDQVSIDDGSISRTRRFSPGVGDIHILDEWWADLGLILSDADHWSGSLAYSRGA